jgi:hypothetical protein
MQKNSGLLERFALLSPCVVQVAWALSFSLCLAPTAQSSLRVWGQPPGVEKSEKSALKADSHPLELDHHSRHVRFN